MTQPLALPNYALLPEFADCEDHHDTCKVAESRFRYLAGGAFSNVYEGNSDRVIKITRPDAGSLATLEAALELPDNPHLPTIYGFRELPDGTLLVEVEALEPVDDEEWERWSGETGLGDSFYEPDPDDCDDPAMADALRLLIAKGRAYGCEWDDHSENVMFRPSDGAVVLTDLLYSRDDLHARHSFY